MVKKIRRVITGHDKDGKAVIIKDGDAENIVTSEHRPGGRTNLWRTTSMPACYGGDKDEADAKFDVERQQSVGLLCALLCSKKKA